jgi:signal peptidase II
MAARAIPASRIVLFLFLAVGGCALDLVTKSWIFQELGFPPRRTIVLAPGVLSLTTNLNPGALFGLGERFTWAFATLSLLAATGIVYWLLRGGARDLWLTVSLGLITAGIFGNLYDRLGFPNLAWPMTDDLHREGDHAFAVRDWIHFQIQAIRFDWPVFNLADSMLVVGAAMLFWHAIWRERKAHIAATVVDGQQAAS